MIPAIGGGIVGDGADTSLSKGGVAPPDEHPTAVLTSSVAADLPCTQCSVTRLNIHPPAAITSRVTDDLPPAQLYLTVPNKYPATVGDC